MFTVDIVSFGRGPYGSGDCVTVRHIQDLRVSSKDLKSLQDLRKVSGDLVVFSGTDEIVPLLDWLWDWEKELFYFDAGERVDMSFAFSKVVGSEFQSVVLKV